MAFHDYIAEHKRYKGAIEQVARSHDWNRMSVDQLGMLLWCLLRYYVQRLKP